MDAGDLRKCGVNFLCQASQNLLLLQTIAPKPTILADSFSMRIKIRVMRPKLHYRAPCVSLKVKYTYHKIVDVDADLLALLARSIIVHAKQLPIITCYDLFFPLRVPHIHMNA